jgi:hypothetical protein
MRVLVRSRRRSSRRAALAVAALACAAACARFAPAPHIRLHVPDEDPSRASIEVVGLAASELDALERYGADTEQWSRAFRVTVEASGPVLSDRGRRGVEGTAAPAVAGRYTVAEGALRFTPMYPLDPGRAYRVTFDRSALPGGGSGAALVTAVVSRPAPPASPATYVTHVSPGVEVVPENHLRMYVHFSAPMGRHAALEHIALLDESGREVKDPFLPLDVEFFDGDRTRYTLFFDPGRVKRGIKPNRDMGPSLVEGRRYTLLVRNTWPDAHGRPLKEPFSRTFTVGPPDLDPLEMTRWTIDPPAHGSRAPVVVSFGEPLDGALLERALGVRRNGVAVDGDVRLDAHGTKWLFTPAAAWSAGQYDLVALSILEDLAGNRLGRAFEVGFVEPRDRAATEPREFTRTFVIGATD